MTDPCIASAPRPAAEIAIRHTVPADLDAIVELYRSLAAHHAALNPARYRVPDAEAVRARFAQVVQDPDNLHLVAVADGRVVGQLDAWVDEPSGPGSTRRPLTSADAGLAVLEAYRGRGIGSALIAAAEAWARDLGLDELRLEVADENADARRLYERLGYAPVTRLLAKPLLVSSAKGDSPECTRAARRAARCRR
jgi:ribosomal protein S18 acetylase RimI-like enzyme